MTEPVTPQRKRILWKLFLSLCLFCAIGLSLIAWYVTTDSFQQLVRRRVVDSIEKIVGGKVELGELHTIPFRLRVDARNLVIHGREAPDQLPFLRVDRVQAELKIISLLSKTIGLHSLILEHPVVHIIAYPDGTTNVPGPKLQSVSDKGPVEELVSLSVSHIVVDRAELLWEDQRVPFDFEAGDLALLLNYSLLRGRYEAHLVAGSVATKYQQYPSFVWRADASLVLARGRADINRLTVTTGKSEVQFNGTVLDFRNPQINGTYRGTADLGELAALIRERRVRRGTAQFEGKLTFSLRDFSTQGSLQSKDIEWSDGRLSTKNGRIAASFSLAPDRLHISSIKANLFGGDVQGDADVTNWQSSLESSATAGRRRVIGRVSQQSPQRGSVRLQLSGFPLSPPLELLSSAKLPLDHLNLSANASGNVDVIWVGSIRDAETHMKLILAPPPKLDPGEVPLHGHIDAIYRWSRDELEVTQSQVTTPGSEVTATGNLAATSTLRFSAVSHNLREWAPLIDAAYGSEELPFKVHGWASLAGNATGKLSAFSIDGNLEVYDFDTTLPATAYLPARAVHWDALNTGIQYSSNHFAVHNGSLIHEHTTAHFDASATLDAGSFPDSAPFTLHLDLRNGDVAEITQIAGINRPLSGIADLSLAVSGTRSNPHGDGRLSVRNGAAYNIEVPALTSDLRLADHEIQFNNIETGAYDARLSGNASISLASLFGSPEGPQSNGASQNQFTLNLTGANLNLVHFPRLQTSRATVDGVADFTVRANGTFQEPTIEAHLHLKDLAFDKERAGDFYVDAVTEGRQLDLKAHSEFGKADLAINGTVMLEQDFLADLSLTFHQLDADSLLRVYLPGKITGHSLLEGKLEVRGPLRTPRDLKAVAQLDSFTVEVEHVQVKNAEPIRFEVADQVVSIQNFHLSGSGTDFTAHGQAHLAGTRELDLKVDGSVNMALFQSLNPKISARGNLGVNLSATGTMSQPVVQGRLEVKNTFVSHNDFPSGLSDLNGILAFDQNRFQIENLKGTTGGGIITLTGSATYQSGGFLLDFGATAQGVRLRYPPGVSSTANADLRLTGNSNSALLSGNVVVTKLAVTPGFDFSAYIEKSKQGGVFNQTDSVQNRLKLDVHVVTTPELQMQTAIARLSGNADLRVRGTVDRPVILGRVEVLEGEISFNGNKYKLERGEVSFPNPAKTQPIIDMQATTRVRDYDITVQFRGDASVANGLKVTWQSEPQLPEADVIALLALGRTREESAQASSNSFGFGGDASSLLINEALNSTVNSRLQRLFGASRVKIDPQGLANETNLVRGPQVTIEQQVANNLTLTYSTNVSVTNQQIIQVEYNVTRNISIVALRDQNGVVSFDFKLRRRRK